MEWITGLIEHEDFWLYFLMPVISAVVGWGTNVVALKMMFYPVEFVGIPPFFGWQGIVPRKAPKMAGLTVDVLVPRLIKVEDLFESIDPAQVVKEMEPALNDLVEQIVNEVMEAQNPKLWEMLPLGIKNRIVKRVRKRSPEIIHAMMEDIQQNIDELLDIKGLIVESLLRDKRVMNALFEDVAQEELRFIRVSGLYFGYLFGLIQMAIWVVVQPWWLLPLGGAIVGFATNWLALKIIFSPIEEKRIGPFRLQGLFLRRQKDVARAYAKVMAAEILHVENVMDALLRGPASDKLFKLIQQQIKYVVDRQVGMGKPFLVFAMKGNGYAEMKNLIADHLFDKLPHTMPHMYDYAQQAMGAEEKLCRSLAQMPAAEFERVLHPVFEEDEWILIAVGAALGLGVGIFQFVVMFGGSLF